MGALVGRERGGEAGLALQAGTLDETENPGIVDISVIVLFERAAREHGGDTELNAHLRLQPAVERTGVVAARIMHRRVGGGDADSHPFGPGRT